MIGGFCDTLMVAAAAPAANHGARLIEKTSMTLFELLYLVAAVLGFVAVIISLLILGRQTRILTEAGICGIYQSFSSHLYSINEVFIEHPELRPCFYSGKHLAQNDPMHARAVSVAEYLLDLFDSIITQEGKLRQLWPQTNWRQYIGDSFARSPLLCEHLVELRSWYSDELFQIMEGATARNKQGPAHHDGTENKPSRRDSAVGERKSPKA